jgi:hypothetical protein
VTDAFVVPDSVDGLRAVKRANVEDSDTEFRPVDQADAKVKLIDALEEDT